MSCMLRVSGETFAVDDFLKRHYSCATENDGATVWHKGDQRASPAMPPLIQSGFNLRISDAEFNDLKGQIDEAIEFLNEDEKLLQALRDEPGIDVRTLDFGIAFKEDVAAQFTRLPAELIYLAGRYNLAIEVSHYWVSDEAKCAC